jgi:hypothetical protein
MSLERPLSMARAFMFFLASDPTDAEPEPFLATRFVEGTAAVLKGKIGTATGGVTRPKLAPCRDE